MALFQELDMKRNSFICWDNIEACMGHYGRTMDTIDKRSSLFLIYLFEIAERVYYRQQQVEELQSIMV